jgi:hypothetical protein
MNQLLKAYLDNELTAEERTKVESDPDFFADLEELRATTEFVKSGAKQIEVKGYDQTIAALAAKPKAAHWLRSPFVALAACTVIAAMLMNLRLPVQMTAPMASADSSVGATSMPAGQAASAVESSHYAEMSKSDGSEAIDRRSNMSQSSDATTTNIPSSAPKVPSSAFNQLIIKNADLSILVKSLQPAAQQVDALTKKHQGYIESSNLINGYNSRTANYTVRVPVERFDQSMADYRALGQVLSESSSGEDVTTQVADLQARLKQMRLEELQYQEVLKQARRISDILEVKNYINDIRQEIEAAEAQAKALKSMAKLSTIRLMVTQREVVTSAPRRDWLSNTWIQAMNRLGFVFRAVVNVLVNVLVLSPVWIPIAAFIWWWTKKRKQ